MTKSELAVLSALQNMNEAATIRQVQKAVGRYVFSYIARAIQNLEAEGLIEERDMGARKAIRISAEGRSALQV